MREAAEERLAQLRDTYGPGLIDRENSEGGPALPGQCPSRTREYLRKVEAARSSVYNQRSRGLLSATSSTSSSGSSHTGSTGSRSVVGGASGRGLREMSSHRGFQAPSTDSVQIDVPTFTEPENIA